MFLILMLPDQQDIITARFETSYDNVAVNYSEVSLPSLTSRLRESLSNAKVNERHDKITLIDDISNVFFKYSILKTGINTFHEQTNSEYMALERIAIKCLLLRGMVLI